MTNTSHLEREIREQPEALARLLARGREHAEAIADAVRAAAPRYVIIAARGTSDNAARYAQYLLGVNNALPVGLAAPSLTTFYHATPRFADALVIGISQSGQSPDIVGVVEEARRQGALTVAITNDPGSPLGRAAAHHLPVFAGPERAVAATKTYTNQLLALAMLSAALAGEPRRWDALQAIPGQVAETLSLNQEITEQAVRFQYAEYLVTIGRGFNLATAFEIALKIKETNYIAVEPYSSADFRHGPIAVVEATFPVLLIAPSGAVYDDVAALLDLLEARGAEIIGLSDRADLLARAGTRLPLPAGIPEWLSPIAAVVPGQMLALALAQARGLDPDHPRGLTKVTETR